MGKTIFKRCAAAVLCLTAAFVPAFSAAAGEGLSAPNLSALFGGGEQQGPSKSKLDAESLRALLSKERNVIVEEQGDMLIVDGRVSSQSAQKRLAKILERYDNILDLTEFIQDEEAILARADYLKQKIEERLNRGYDANRAFAPMQRVDYDIVENEVVVVGELNNEEDVSRVSRIIDTYEKGFQDERGATGGGQDASASGDHLTVAKVPLEVDIIFARMSANDQRILGLGGLITGVVTIPELTYAPAGTGATAGGGASAGTAQGVYNPLRVFNGSSWTAGEGGLAFDSVSLSLTELETSDRILSRPHLSTLNGTSARFHAGGQIGMRLIGSDSSTVEWKDYGTILTATPTLTTDGRIHMKLNLEVTTPTGSPGGNDVGFTRFEHESEAIISANQGMILSGIIRSLRTRGGDGIPGLRKIPILGYFFGSRNRQMESEELVIVAIPRFTEVVNNPPVTNTLASSRIVNGVVQDLRYGEPEEAGLREKWRFSCDPGATPDMEAPRRPVANIRIDVQPPQVTLGDALAPSPAMGNAPPPSYAPQEMDFMGDLVTFH